MPFVVDASVAAAWALKDERAPLANACLDRLAADRAMVPALFWFEARNVLVINERRSRLSVAESAEFLGLLDHLPMRVDHAPESGAVFDLARRHRLTIYDAAYLELAQRLALPLATLDQRLAKAATSEAIRPFAP